MSSTAASTYDHFYSAPRPYSRKSRFNRVLRSWDQVAVHAAAMVAKPSPSKVPAYAGWLAGTAFASHALFAWYITHSESSQPPLVQKREVVLEFVAPKPPEPRIEPPKPQPPKPEVKRPAKVLPPIQTASPDPAPSDAVSNEAPVAVEPFVEAVPAPDPEPLTAPVGHAGYLNNPPPEYPPAAVRQRWQGTVVLRVHVLSGGTVDVVEIDRSSGKKLLDEQAVRTVRTWLFSPAKRGDTAVDGWAVVPIEFRLAS